MDPPEEAPRDWGPLYDPVPLPRMLRPVQEVVAELGRPLTERERVQLLDEAEVIRAVADGCSMNAICRELGVSWWALSKWLRESTTRRDAYEEARRLAATMFEERAEAVLTAAPPTLAELTRAKAIAALLQRRAQTHDPTLYGDRQQVQVTHDVIGELRDRIHAASSRLPLVQRVDKSDEISDRKSL